MKLVDCPRCLGSKKFLKSRKKSRKMTNCTLCNEEGKLSEDLADDYVKSKIVVYDPDSY